MKQTYEQYRAEMFKYHQFVIPMTFEEWSKYND
ncbi:hypothetical protein VLVyarbaL_00046 [Erwinia phage VyarbaL]|nr:hypothetical protein VLVyarbaL_00046 [Erwinia phage VyarbaL]WJN64903.1 hypothetical protein Erwinia_phage_Tapenade_00011 [Erwinia phage Tapenade]